MIEKSPEIGTIYGWIWELEREGAAVVSEEREREGDGRDERGFDLGLSDLHPPKWTA